MLPTTDSDGFERQLAEVSDAKRERQRLLLQQAVATTAIETAAAEVAERRAALVSEVHDVQRLESVSLTRILSTVTGHHDDDLRREIAEYEAARLALAAADARLEGAIHGLGRVNDRLAALGDVDERWDEVLEQRERWMAITQEPNADRLTALAERRGEVDSELRECDEALAAGHLAGTQLAEVAKALGSAHDWSGVDTWFGGGVITSSAKYDRLDDATALLRQADVALTALRQELGELGHAGVDTLTIDRWDRTFDVFCDNLFTDLDVHRRVNEAITQVEKLRTVVAKITEEVRARANVLATESVDLQTERRRLLDGGT